MLPESFSFRRMFYRLRLSTQELLNYLRTRRLLGTDKLLSDYRDAQLPNLGGVVLLRRLLTKEERRKLQISTELRPVKQAESPQYTTRSEGHHSSNSTILRPARNDWQDYKKGQTVTFFLKIYSHTVPVLIQNQWSLNVKQKPEHQRATKQSSTANVLKLQAAENKLFHRDHVRFTDVCSHIPITEFKALLYVLTLTMQ